MYRVAIFTLLFFGNIYVSTADDQLDLYWDEKAYTRCPKDKPLDGLMGGRYGGFFGADRIALDQGRINGIQKWGLQHPTESNNYPWLDWAVVIQEWTADDQTVSNKMEFGNQKDLKLCQPFQLADDDYIIGYKAWFHDVYVFGLEFYTKSGLSYPCYNKKRIKQDDIETGKDFFDCGDGSFYYLVGFKIRSGVILDAIRGQYARLPQTCDCYSVDLVAETNDGQGSNCYKYTLSENYPGDIKCQFGLKKIELGLGNAARRCDLKDKDLPGVITSFNAPDGVSYTLPRQPVKNTFVTGINIKGLSIGDEFEICFDENVVSGTRGRGNIEFTPKKYGRDAFQCPSKGLFNACPNGVTSEFEEPEQNKDVEFEMMVMGYDNENNKDVLNNNYWYLILFISTIIIIGGIIYYRQNKDGKYESLLSHNTQSGQYQSV